MSHTACFQVATPLRLNSSVISRSIRFSKQSIQSCIPAKYKLPRRLLFPLTLLPFLPSSALADRTGKFSTKLTAKRRYLPRISAGLQQLSELFLLCDTDPLAAANKIDDTLSQDLPRAMDLFATTYFSEGNRISEREKQLSSCVQQIKKGLMDVKKFATKNDVKAVSNSFQAVRSAVDDYVDTSKLKDLTPVDG